ncbi:hypothetical protein CRYUN_Cryun37aG0049900 [Craigia yunnanensis]
MFLPIPKQTNNLQWTLASVPLIKALQLTLSFLFWYSCFYLQLCSLWMSFGEYVTGVLFQTASFVFFLLICHGYCITCERLSVTERRTTAALGCVFYLTLVGYRASVAYFTVLLLLNYIISLYVIFHHISQNLLVLREQLTFIEEEDVQSMRDAVYMKYIMFNVFGAGGAFGGNRGLRPVPSEKGIFPLDHLHESDLEKKEYLNCLKTSGHKSEKCRQFSKKYLQCRMEKLQRNQFSAKKSNSLGLWFAGYTSSKGICPSALSSMSSSSHCDPTDTGNGALVPEADGPAVEFNRVNCLVWVLHESARSFSLVVESLELAGSSAELAMA